MNNKIKLLAILNLSSKLPNGDYLTVLVVDKGGQRCPDYGKRIYFSSDIIRKIIRELGITVGSSIIKAANGEAHFEFKPNGNKRPVIKNGNQDFKEYYSEINQNNI